MLKKLLYVPVLTVSAQMAIAGETSTENGFSITPTLGAGFAHLRTENPSFSANADDMNYTEMYIKPGAIVDYSFSFTRDFFFYIVAVRSSFLHELDQVVLFLRYSSSY